MSPDVLEIVEFLYLYNSGIKCYMYLYNVNKGTYNTMDREAAIYIWLVFMPNQ